MSFYIDLTEFLVNPITTGIQRIVGEMCIYSPPNTMVPVRLYEGRYVALPAALVEAIGRLFSKGSQSGVEEINELGYFEFCFVHTSDVFESSGDVAFEGH